MAKTPSEHEWFDRDYSTRQVYGRLWRAARRYWLMLGVGVLCGMAVGGSWLPVFQMLKPALEELQAPPAVERQVEAESVQAQGAPKTVEAPVSPPKAEPQTPVWLERTERAAGYLGLQVRDAKGEFKGAFLLLAVLVLPLVLLFRLATVYLNNYCLRWVSVHVVKDLRNSLFAHLQEQSLAFFGRIEVGRIMSRALGDPQQIDSVMSVTIAELCRAPFEILVSLAFVVYFAIEHDLLGMIAIAVIGYPICMYPIVQIGKWVRKWSRRMMECSAVLQSGMVENLTGIRLVKACNTEQLEIDRFAEKNRQVVKTTLRAERLSLFVSPVTETASILLASIFLLICYWSGKGFADILPLLVPFVVAYKPIKSLGKLQTSIERGRAALSRVYSLLDLDTALPQPQNPVGKKHFDSAITFEQVGFSYGAGKTTLEEIDFQLRKGQTIAVVGSTGSGKSTIANLLCRFYDPTSGRVALDGIPLDQINPKDLRNLIGIVTQETVLFNTTIAQNIAYGRPEATLEQIIQAAKLANAHDFIASHPDGYSRIVGDKGFVLSGGERQRIAIARAILRNPPILVLDEATSALDTVTEQQVQQAITHLMANRTVFAIAHRLSTIRQADLILVLDKGRIIERGTHAQLYAQGGVYRRLCDIQHQSQ